MSGNNIRSFIIIAVVVLFVATVAVLRRSPPLESSEAANASRIGTTNPQAEIVPAQATMLPRMLDLGADKCIPCKKMAPILAELKTEYAGRAVIEFLDVWKNPSVGQEYGVRAIPTQIFYDRKGKEIWRHEGFLGKDDIVAKLKELGAV